MKLKKLFFFTVLFNLSSCSQKIDITTATCTPQSSNLIELYPWVSRSADHVITLQSNKPDTIFKIDGNIPNLPTSSENRNILNYKTSPSESISVAITCDIHKITAEKEGYTTQTNTIQPPFKFKQKYSFYFSIQNKK